MIKLFKRLVGVIISPKKTILGIIEQGYLRQESFISILIYSILSIFAMFFYILLIRQPNKNIPLYFYFILIFTSPLFYFILYFKIWVDSFFIKLFSSMFKGNNDLNNYFNIYSYLWPPFFLLLLFNSTISKSNLFNISYDSYVLIFTIIFYIWYYVLSIISLKKLNNFTLIKSGLVSLALFIQLVFIKLIVLLKDFLK